ncbi:MAG: hypothetical protein HYY04_03505 [Chloroflexi bacterium]|nr:hypothetical protein [Chloroflexota bacterium]
MEEMTFIPGRRAVRRVLGGPIALLIVALALALWPAPGQAGNQAWTRRDLDGVRVTALDVDPTNPFIVFAGGFGNGAFRTTDGGLTWQAINTGLGNLFVNAFSVDPTNPAVVLAGSGRGSLVGEPDAGVFRTTNRGATWTGTLVPAFVASFARSPQNPQIVYAGGSGPVFRSNDGGVTWVRLAPAGSPILGTEIRGVAVSPTNANVVLAVGNTEGGTGQVFRTTDGGASWTLVLGGQAPVFDVAFATDSVAFFGGLGGLFRSTNGGVSWGQVGTNVGAIDPSDLLVNPLNPAELFVGTNGSGVFRTTDGVNLSLLDGTLGNRNVNELAIDRATPQTLYAGTNDGAWVFSFAPAPLPFTPVVSWFFAEGSTQPPFDTWFLIQNPTAAAATVRFTFQFPGGGTQTRDFVVGPTSRFSLFANQVIPNVPFSTRIDANQQVFAERAMFVSFDGHAVTGIPGPNRTWLFAEGSTQNPFHTWLLLQNPNNQPATATITYLRVAAAPQVQILSLPPNSRTSIFVNQVLPNEAFSSRIDSDLPIIAERAMFRFPGNAATGVSGVNGPSPAWFFAEGNTTQSPTAFDSWLLLQNPNPVSVVATITLFQENGNTVTLAPVLPPTSRQSVFLNQVLLNASFGIRVEATAPIIAERSMFFGVEPRGAHATQGASELKSEWNLAEGSTQAPFTEVIAILNPHAAVMNVHVDFELPGGQVIGRDFTIGPTRKLSITVDQIIPDSPVSARVTTSLPSAVERTLFLNKLGSLGGTNTIGIAR